MEPLDPLGTIIQSAAVALLFLLVLGLPLVRGINTKKNLKRHGILATVGLILQIVLILVTMVPAFPEISGKILTLQPMYAFNTWLHIIAGSAAITSGIVYSGMWLAASSSAMGCTRAKKFMMPTLIVWIAAIITGALIHFL
ncbi:MAG: hypothetical protein M1490_05255 [Candidatus Bathyarchaeota archaeon]|nr:hypothetical protein [Candidatus Bathyarchaeota archaeon]